MDYCPIKLNASDHTISIFPMYGCHYQKETTDFSVYFFFDLINRRLKIEDYSVQDFDKFTNYLEFLCRENKLTKIIMTAQENDWQELFIRGFLLESLHPNFFRGKPGYHLSKFLAQERRNSQFWDREDQVLKEAVKITSQIKPLPKEYEIRRAQDGDIQQLADLFSTVFKTYPTPLNQTDYLGQMMKEHSVFWAVFHQGQAVSAASLDIDHKTLSAELTDCATLSEYRGQSLMSHLVENLEEEAKSLGLSTLYTIARALSIGINAVFARLGYHYYGRFANNCDICGQFEDMNLWSKEL